MLPTTVTVEYYENQGVGWLEHFVLVQNQCMGIFVCTLSGSGAITWAVSALGYHGRTHHQQAGNATGGEAFIAGTACMCWTCACVAGHVVV